MKIPFLKKEKSFKKEVFILKINTYWRTVVCFMFVTTALSFGFGYYLFMQINKESTDFTNENTRKTIAKEKIEKALEYFSLRKEKSDKIINSPSPIVDPSL